ncbi:cellobiose phosphorylase [Ruminiclostridium sufflavum DSM 19573]|uniref:Cellobiose phosphorylase n=1 Tax=Ruminiclostridium sufflavum DSM 19573 TaxID=1121337 RepID=A0A318XWT7_9FIRM|nr:cellobiose phosphorylase [Ruminiclostridium sufflavum DSM 19573]
MTCLIIWIKRLQTFEFQIEDVVLSVDELEKHAENLAKAQDTEKRRHAMKRITKRIETKFQDIFLTYKRFNEDTSAGFSVPPAAEWLLDNFYIIEEQKGHIVRELSEIRQALPVINEGIYTGFPRIYTIAVEIVSHIDGNASDKIIKDFITAYQKYNFLSIQELWMLTLMVKAALIEKLWVVCEKMNATRNDWYRAEQILDIVIDCNKAEDSCQTVNSYIEELDDITPAFVEYLIKKLRKKGSKTLWMISCIDNLLAQKSTTTDSFISIDHLNQAVTQVSIGNVINSLRALSGLDSTVLFEELSEVERILKQDPCEVYSKMDFNSRNLYRNTIVKLADKYGTTEINAARISHEFAKEAFDANGKAAPAAHVGYYLVGKGQRALIDALNLKSKKEIKNTEINKTYSVNIYISAIAILSAVIAIIPMLYSIKREAAPAAAVIILTAAVGLIPAGEIVISIVNSLLGRLVKPAVLPKLELKNGIPQELSAMVIVPTLVPNVKRTLDLINNLEVAYLANKCGNIYFSLVGDFKDSEKDKLPEDAAIVEAAKKRVNELNIKYAENGRPIFFFFCRERRFSQKQNKWLGWERKRGAIIEFNRMLRGDSSTSYIHNSIDISDLPDIKYVITLDADTQLPVETAKQLVGTISHPLNRAVFDEGRGIVTEGYGILQPRVNVDIQSANVSFFTRVFAGQGGIDPYTTTVSDVYQDTFGEGIFTGKGIYEVDIFQKALDKAFPENTILSHDLLEGSYLRTGLVTDIELIDGYPSKYNSYMMRLHRWTRGDWQLLHWIFGKVPINRLSKWKLFDNLRRSMLYPSIIIILLLSMAFIKSGGIAFMCLCLVALCSPVVSYFVHLIFAGDYRIYITKRRAVVLAGFKGILVQIGLLLTFAPYQAFLMINAVSKTLARVLVTKKDLLEWVTAADMELALKNDPGSYYRRMWFSPVFGATVFILGLFMRAGYIWFGLAAFIIWALAPWIAYNISKPSAGKSGDNGLRISSLKEFRLLARKTWCYFDEFAGRHENFLPADNYQVEPYKGTAHRTSPTNIGLLLVSNLAARDMGYINTLDLLDRIENTINTVEKLEKWNGHLYNWYNTASFEILHPKFISTVDSGNFAGYLMVLKEGLEEYGHKPVYDESVPEGIIDLLELCNFEIDKDKPYFDLEGIKNVVCADSGANSAADAKTMNVKGEAAGTAGNAGAGEQAGIEQRIRALFQVVSEALNELVTSRKTGYWVGKLVCQVDMYHAMLGKYGGEIFGNLEGIPDKKPRLDRLIGRIQALIDNMQFKGLFDEGRGLFSIGFNAEEGHTVKSYYDLFASEARQTSLIAIAKGEIGKQHWFKLGRKLVNVDGSTGLASWTGTMFEYLMPRLLIKSYSNTLIEKTYKFAVNAQIKYGMSRNIPWGISESCFYAFDIALNYQYRAFGVPGLGLKRGLINDLVVAPYATIMAIDIEPAECAKNIERLRSLGAEGQFGLYEAVDFTESRLKDRQECAVVKSYMVHHQGMSMLALVNFFKNNIMQKRFHVNPQIESVDVLLQEKFPAGVVISKEHKEQPLFAAHKQADNEEIVIRSYKTPGVIPNMHVLTNGSYTAVLTDKGSGYGRCNSMAVYRWVNDYMQSSGAFIYIRNVNSNEYWSVSYSPINTEPEAYKVIFAPHKAEYIRREGNIETNTEVLISTEDNTEIRKVTIFNHSTSQRVVELTSYMEIVLSQPEADAAHPAFSKLFVKTEYIDEYNGLLAVRRRRDDVKQTAWGYHTVSVDGKVQGKVEYETNRMNFTGRNRTLAAPAAMEPDQPLSNSAGSVLDPVFSLRIRVCIEPGASAVVNFSIGTCDTRENAVCMLEKYCDTLAAERVVEMAWTRSIVEAGFLNVSAVDERAYLRLLPGMLYGIDRREQSEYIQNNTLSQPELWPLGISGDVPVVLIKIQDRDSFEEVQWALKLHDYYRLKGIVFDLVILISEEEAYNRPIFEMVNDMAVSGRSYEHIDRKGGIFIRSVRQMKQEQLNLLLACARLTIDADKGIAHLLDKEEMQASLIDSEDRTHDEIYDRISGRNLYENTQAFPPAAKLSEMENSRQSEPDKKQEALQSFEPGSGKEKKRGEYIENDNEGNRDAIEDDEFISSITEKLLFFNGIGGFSNDGNEYVICLKPGQNTPAPWVNIIANDIFGFICTESGGGYTWHRNSSQNKLTAWVNDPVLDVPSEIIYFRDTATDRIWTCTPSPVRERPPYVIRHGFGYTCYLHKSHGLEQEQLQFAAAHNPVKITIVKLKNITEKKITLDIAYYLRPVLGVEASQTAPYIITSFDSGIKSIFAENVYSADFRGLTAFLSCSEENITYTGQRLEFIGESMDLSEPSGMRNPLNGNVGAGYDPCAVTKTCLSILPGELKQVVFLFGQEKKENAGEIIKKYRNINYAQEEFKRVREDWNQRLKQIQVSTPDTSFNVLLNGWLQYQVLSSRIFARTGFYQAGGAVGFRDQLQDVMSVVYTLPELTKNQILLHCRHQFVEGDVQHWWHEQKANGIRTRYSDDLLWLPYVTCDYLNATGDYKILNISESYLQSEALKENEHERYEVPSVSEIKGTVYEHCIKAVDKSLVFGAHGIPLMGGGDWNDGMNLIGAQGKGESVWLGWFLYCVLQKIIPVCIHMGDAEKANLYKTHAAKIIEAIEKEAWDGSWYRRAYFDDGNPLGSISNDEGKIDSLSQSWAAISAAARSSRVEESMSALEKYLIDRKNGIIKLLTPPFCDSVLNPGYIKGYLPGVRENGGQYTHAATWVIYAYCRLGNGEQAWELYNMVNPINHTRTDMERMKYKVEPYVMAADVYAVHPNEGRGGWTWYTGAAGWMYRIGIEHILGIKKQGNYLKLAPCIPKKMKEYSVRYIYGEAVYDIRIINSDNKNTGISRIKIDERTAKTDTIELIDDGRTHRIEVYM